MNNPDPDFVKKTRKRLVWGKMKQYLRFITVLVILAITVPGFSYPLDAYPETGIRRVEAARLAVFGKMRGR